MRTDNRTDTTPLPARLNITMLHHEKRWELAQEAIARIDRRLHTLEGFRKQQRRVWAEYKL